MKLSKVVEEKCPECRYDIPLAWSFCPHCGRPQRFPNVIASKVAEEREALGKRYEKVVNEAKKRRCVGKVRSFEKAVRDKARVVIGRPFEEICRLLVSDRNLYGTYYGMIDAGLRLPTSDGWDVVRRGNEEEVFPGYKEHIRFGNLALNSLGLASYGRCFIILRNDMIAHRTSLYDGNCVVLVEQFGRRQVPPGFRAPWPDRARLCVAKLGDKVLAATAEEDYAGILVMPSARSENAEFVEAHVFGPLSRHSIEKIVVLASADLSEKLEAQMISERCAQVGIKFEES